MKCKKGEGLCLLQSMAPHRGLQDIRLKEQGAMFQTAHITSHSLVFP